MLGVVAQELEASNMNGLVEAEVLYTATDLEVINKDKNVGDIKSYKTVKYSKEYTWLAFLFAGIIFVLRSKIMISFTFNC